MSTLSRSTARIENASNTALRRSIYARALGTPLRVEPAAPAKDGQPAVEILIFERDFCPDVGDTDMGYVLITSGLSDQAMALDEDALEEGVSGRFELVWYVREPTAEILDSMRWLGRFPFTQQTWLGAGHTVKTPGPILAGSALTTWFLLPPIIDAEQQIVDSLRVDGESVELLVVHLLTDAEYAL